MKMIILGVMPALMSGCAWLNPEAWSDRLDMDGDTFVSTQYGGDDCDDFNDDVFPGAFEQPYDGVDSDCDGWSDNDQDRDGADAYEFGGTDCDDADPDIIDEIYWYPDEDKDGYGDRDLPVQQCESPNNFIGNGQDCDDGNEQIRPGQIETCDGLDNNCDDIVDPSGSDGSQYFYPDKDGDGFGDEKKENWELTCFPSDGFLERGLDCDDTDAEVNPAYPEEICNDLKDNNCLWGPDHCEVGGFGYATPRGAVPATSDLRIGPSKGDLGDTLVTDGQFGWWAGGIGDIDHDGVDDLMISAPEDDVNKGRLYFFRGRTEADGGLGLEHQEEWSADSADLIYEGGRADGFIGGRAQPLGDLNGDGVDDLGVDHCGRGLRKLGDPSFESSILLFFGSSGFWSDPHETSHRVTNLRGALFGKGTALVGCAMSAGDMDGDGFLDLVTSSPGELYDDTSMATKRSNGVVYVTYGPITGDVDVATDSVRVVSSLSTWSQDVVGHNLTMGDMNGDGIQDLAITTLAGEEDVGFGGGAVYLRYGSTERLDILADADGNVVLDLDNFDARFSGDSSYGAAGEGLKMGDVNGDGADDLVVTNPKHGGERGIIYVMPGNGYSKYEGAWSLWNADVRLRGNQEGDVLGQTIDVIAPKSEKNEGLNGDDAADLWVGGGGQNPAETAYLVYGPLSNLSDTIGNKKHSGMFPMSTVQRSVVPNIWSPAGSIVVNSAGDFNGDRYVDLVAAFPWYNSSTDGDTQDGIVTLFLGGGI